MKISKILVLTIFIVLTLASAYLIADIYGITKKGGKRFLAMSIGTYCDFPLDVEYGILPSKDKVLVGVNLKTTGDFKTCSEIRLRIRGYDPNEIIGYTTKKNYKSITTLEGDIRVLELDWNYLQANGFENLRVSFPGAIHEIDSANSELRGSFSIESTSGNQRAPTLSTFLSLESRYVITKSYPEVSKTKVEPDNVKHWVVDSVPFNEQLSGAFIVSWKDPELEKDNILRMLLLSALFGIGISGIVEMMISFFDKR
jgi:hypothetical protein